LVQQQQAAAAAESTTAFQVYREQMEEEVAQTSHQAVLELLQHFLKGISAAFLLVTQAAPLVGLTHLLTANAVVAVAVLAHQEPGQLLVMEWHQP
jgi:hypothetical protein